MYKCRDIERETLKVFFDGSSETRWYDAASFRLFGRRAEGLGGELGDGFGYQGCHFRFGFGLGIDGAPLKGFRQGGV